MREEGYSETAIDLYLKSWRQSTKKVYNSYIEKWKSFALSNNDSITAPSVVTVTNFLAGLFHSGVGHSAINSARSARSSFCVQVDGFPVGKHPRVCRVLKGIFEERPSLPKYVHTWDVNNVLKSLEKSLEANELTLKDLTLKLALLLSLITGQRGQALHLLKVNDIIRKEDNYTLIFSDKHKTTRPGFHTAPVTLFSFDNSKLCIVKHLDAYLKLTKDLRKGNDLFISTQKPHAAVTRNTFSRWIKTALSNAGVDTAVFSPHSTRSASTSAANKCGASTGDILKAASWSSVNTFRRFYCRDIEDHSVSFANAVLSGH